MTTVNHECYVSLEVANLLIKAGFDWRDYFVAHSIDEHFHWEIPLHIAQRWLREVKGRLVLVGSVPEYFFCTIYEYKRKIDHIFIESDSPFDTYEEALEAGIKEALELILEKGE